MSDLATYLPRSLQEGMDWLIGRTSKKDKKTPPLSEEPRPYLDPQYSKAKVIDLDIREIVRLPTGFEYNEWIGTTTLSFFNNINILYSVLVNDYCNNESCPSMSAPNNVQYTWQDEKGKKAKCTAPQYIEYAMSYAERQFKDENVFPTKYGQVFPADFQSIIQRINRYFFHLLAHIYHSHFLHLLQFELHCHLNSIFCHYVHFLQEFGMLDSKDTYVLEDLIEVLQLNNKESQSSEPSGRHRTLTRIGGISIPLIRKLEPLQSNKFSFAGKL